MHQHLFVDSQITMHMLSLYVYVHVLNYAYISVCSNSQPKDPACICKEYGASQVNTFIPAAKLHTYYSTVTQGKERAKRNDIFKWKKTESSAYSPLLL